MTDLPLAVNEAEIIMYADDTSLSKSIRTTNELTEQLIPAFSKVCEWFNPIPTWLFRACECEGVLSTPLPAKT